MGTSHKGILVLFCHQSKATNTTTKFCDSLKLECKPIITLLNCIQPITMSLSLLCLVTKLHEHPCKFRTQVSHRVHTCMHFLKRPEYENVRASRLQRGKCRFHADAKWPKSCLSFFGVSKRGVHSVVYVSHSNFNTARPFRVTSCRATQDYEQSFDYARHFGILLRHWIA